MIKVISESKTQTEPDDYLEFSLEGPLYFANQFRRALTIYPELYAFSKFDIIENTTNIENANLITRIELLPIKQSLIKNENEQFKIDFSYDNNSLSTELISDMIKPNICPLGCMFGVIFKGEKVNLKMGLEKGIGKKNAKFQASSTIIFKNQTKEKMPGEITKKDIFVFKIISVGAITPREQCKMTLEGIIQRLDKIKGDFNDCIEGKISNITYVKKSKDEYRFLIENNDEHIIYLIRSKIIELYPQIGNVGYDEGHAFNEKYTFNIYEKSKDPIKILFESIEETKKMTQKYLKEFK
jgi:DNA-directed RNA polymerase subunit L